jgi:hypothetical protein
MKTNTCTIVVPRYEQEQSYDQGGVIDHNGISFVPETCFMPKEPRDTKALVEHEHKFKKKIANYDKMCTHFSFK